jgi:CubicO group peptidase (beta-lactamase class C family)
MRKVVFLLTVFLLVGGQALAQQSARLDVLDAYFSRALKEWKVPGMAVAIVKDDKVIFARGYGVRESGKPDRVDERTLFAIASNTKAFTAAALGILVDEKKLTWDGRVMDSLPYFQLYDPYVTFDFRIRDLLSHRSGLGTFSGDLLWYGTPYSREEIVRRARFLKPAGAFRARYGYQNLMFIAAGEAVAAASGTSWDGFVRERIFDPLGMTETVTSITALRQKPNVATPHARLGGEWRTFPWANWDSMAAAGGIISSVSDMAKWIRLQLGRGALDGKRIFSEAAQEAMWTPHTPRSVSAENRLRFPSTHFSSYGLGWNLWDYRGRRIIDHGGAYDGMFSHVALVPEENLGFVILTNSTTPIADALTYSLLDAYLGSEMHDWSKDFLDRSAKAEAEAAAADRKRQQERVPGTKPSLALNDYTGTYGGDLYGDAAITFENGSLVLRLKPNPDMVADLSHWHHDTFLIQWRKPFPWWGNGWVQFIMDNRGKTIELKLDVPNEDFWFWEPEFKKK